MIVLGVNDPTVVCNCCSVSFIMKVHNIGTRSGILFMDSYTRLSSTRHKIRNMWFIYVATNSRIADCMTANLMTANFMNAKCMTAFLWRPKLLQAIIHNKILNFNLYLQFFMHSFTCKTETLI